MLSVIYDLKPTNPVCHFTSSLMYDIKQSNYKIKLKKTYKFHFVFGQISTRSYKNTNGVAAKMTIHFIGPGWSLLIGVVGEDTQSTKKC